MVIKYKISNHYIIVAYTINQEKNSKICNFKSYYDEKLIKEKLKEKIFDDIKRERNINVEYRKLVDKFENIYESCKYTKKEIRIKNNKEYRKCWMTGTLLDMLNRKYRPTLFRRWKSNKTNRKYRKEYRPTAYRNLVINEIRVVRKNYNKKFSEIELRNV